MSEAHNGSVRSLCIVCGIAVLGAAFVAGAAAQVPIEGSGSLDIAVIQHTAHSPCASAAARIPVTEGPLFLATGGIGYDDCLGGTWTMACTETGLVYECDIAGIPEWYEWGRWAEVIVHVECVLPVTEPLVLRAERAFDSGPVVMEGRHDVVLTAPDGTESRLFADDSATLQAARTLEAGQWRIAIDVYITLADRNLMQYAGSVVVDWAAGVPAEERSWGEVKAVYR